MSIFHQFLLLFDKLWLFYGFSKIGPWTPFLGSLGTHIFVKNCQKWGKCRQMMFFIILKHSPTVLEGFWAIRTSRDPLRPPLGDPLICRGPQGVPIYPHMSGGMWGDHFGELKNDEKHHLHPYPRHSPSFWGSQEAKNGQK